MLFFAICSFALICMIILRFLFGFCFQFLGSLKRFQHSFPASSVYQCLCINTSRFQNTNPPYCRGKNSTGEDVYLFLFLSAFLFSPMGYRRLIVGQPEERSSSEERHTPIFLVTKSSSRKSTASYSYDCHGRFGIARFGISWDRYSNT